MTGTINIHATGVLASLPGVGILLAFGTGAPTALTVGYATGCLYQRIDGSTDTALYLNEGTAAAATWVVITTT